MKRRSLALLRFEMADLVLEGLKLEVEIDHLRMAINGEKDVFKSAPLITRLTKAEIELQIANADIACIKVDITCIKPQVDKLNEEWDKSNVANVPCTVVTFNQKGK